MIVIRSVVFNVIFYLVLFVYLIAAMPTLLMPRGALLAMVKNWSRVNLWLLKVICNIDCEFRGLHNIPNGAALIASKHQSMWETFALITVLEDPAYILKRELLWIPFFGWCAAKAEMIPVDRGKRSQALAAMTERARERNREGPRDHHLSGGHAARARRRAEIQVRCRVSLHRAWCALRSGRAEFGAVLAAAFVPALSRRGAR